MTGWDEGRGYGRSPHDEDEWGSGNRQTVRQFAVRVVAILVLFSVLGSAFLALRRIEHIGLVMAILGIAALVAILAGKQRESENPYESPDRRDFGTH